MHRWIAIGRLPGWQDFQKFRDDLKAPQKWRLDAKMMITEVLVLEDGRIVAECHAADRSAFEQWLQDKGLQIESLSRISHLSRTGETWRV